MTSVLKKEEKKARSISNKFHEYQFSRKLFERDHTANKRHPIRCIAIDYISLSQMKFGGRSERNRQTERQIQRDRQTERQRDRDRETDRQTEGQRD